MIQMFPFRSIVYIYILVNLQGFPAAESRTGNDEDLEVQALTIVPYVTM